MQDPRKPSGTFSGSHPNPVVEERCRQISEEVRLRTLRAAKIVDPPPDDLTTDVSTAQPDHKFGYGR